MPTHCSDVTTLEPSFIQGCYAGGPDAVIGVLLRVLLRLSLLVIPKGGFGMFLGSLPQCIHVRVKFGNILLESGNRADIFV